jgi:hypothetical protein
MADAGAPARAATAAPSGACAAAAADFDGVTLPEHLRAVAERELGETPERRAAALAELRERLGRLPESERPSDTTDAALLRALRPRKFSVDKAFALIKARDDFPRR